LLSPTFLTRNASWLRHAGGYIAKKIYDKNYISDADIWIHKDTDLSTIFNNTSTLTFTSSNESLTIDIPNEVTKYDIVPKDTDPYSCISTSDRMLTRNCV